MKKLLEVCVAIGVLCLIVPMFFVFCWARANHPELTSAEPKEEVKENEEVNENKTVWVVRYNSLDFGDCEGVFETREKARASVLADAERCKDIWENFQKVKLSPREETWDFYTFTCQGTLEGVTIYQTEIQ